LLSPWSICYLLLLPVSLAFLARIARRRSPTNSHGESDAFERRGEQAIQGLAFFFGLLFVGEVSLVLIFGVDYRFVEARYIGPSLHLGFVDLPLRMLLPCVFSLIMVAGLQLYLTRSFVGRAILAVSQDPGALQLMAASPTGIKQIAFGISIATCSVAGSFLIIIQQVEPSIGRDYIGRIFAICVLGGMTSMPGMLVAALLLGIVESITATAATASIDSPSSVFSFPVGARPRPSTIRRYDAPAPVSSAELDLSAPGIA